MAPKETMRWQQGGAMLQWRHLLSSSVLFLLYTVVIHSRVEKQVIPPLFASYRDQLVAAREQLPHTRLEISPCQLDNFTSPLEKPLQASYLGLPGVPRPYRNGIHQGIDFYGVEPGTLVFPVQEGIVLRIDSEYVPLAPRFRQELLRLTKLQWHGTPGAIDLPPALPPYGDVLDKLLGRQVWLYHGQDTQGNLIITRYGHLSAVIETVSPLDRVTINTAIGVVGNTGTSFEGKDPLRELHLHLEIYIGGHYWHPQPAEEIGQSLNPERKRVLQHLIVNLFRPRNTK